MKAAFRNKYGSPTVLDILEMDVPVPRGNEILVKVMAATVNRTDCAILWGKPFIMKMIMGFPRPRKHTTGTDFAGIVESVGDKVTAFKPGDRVWGFDDSGLGSHAEYLVISASKPVSVMPGQIMFVQAAASLEGAHYAINFINKVKVQAGQKVMVNGATGAIGSAAIQILKSLGLSITATCNTKNIELVRSLGAERIIDYTVMDFTLDEEKYDFVFDTVGKSTFGKCKRLLKSSGRYISSELGPNGQNLFFYLAFPFMGSRKVMFPYPRNIKESLNYTKELIEKGYFQPVIDRAYSLDKIRDAFEYVASGQKTGNVVINMEE